MTGWWSATNKIMKRLSFIAAALLCFVTAVSAAIRPAQPGIGGGGSSGVTTGSVTVLTPLILSGTEIQLPLELSNLKTNLALTNANANQFSTSGGTAIKSGVLLTNTVNEGNFTNNTTGAGFIRQISSAANGGFEAIVGGTTLASLSTLLGIRATNTLGSKLLVSDDVGAHSFMSRTGTFFSGHLLLDSNLVVSGGSTLSSLTASRPLILNASGNVTNATGTPDGTKFLRDDGTLAVPSGSGTPGGSTTQIQYNNAGAFGGSSLFTYEEASSTGAATVRGTSSGAPSLRVAFDNGTVKRTNMMFETGLQLYSNQNDPSLSLAVGYFGSGFSTVAFYTNRFLPTVTNHYDAGTFLLPFRTNYANDFVAKNSVTAQSFIGSGTGTPILKLQTMMSSDNAFAITVATNWMQSTTNSFVFSNVVAGQVISALSSSAGQVVWTNATAAGGGASVTFSAIPTALNSVSNYAKQLMFQSMKPNASTSFDRQSAESPNTQGGAEVPPVNASLPIGLSATNHTGLYGWFPSSDLFHYSTRDHVSTFLVSLVGQTSSNRTWIGLSGAAAVYNTDVPGTPTYGFRHSSIVADNNWVCYSADGTRTVSNLVTTGSITTNVLYALATVKTGTNVIFYVDGSPKFTNHFDPAGAVMSYRIIGSKAGATGARSGIILHDYFSTTTIP